MRTWPTTCTTTPDAVGTPVVDGGVPPPPGVGAGVATADALDGGPAPTGTAPAVTPVGPARDPPPGAMTVPSPADRAHATRSPNTAVARTATTTTPTSAALAGCHRAPTNAAGRRTQAARMRHPRVPPTTVPGVVEVGTGALPFPPTRLLGLGVGAPSRTVEVEGRGHVGPRARPQPGQGPRRERLGGGSSRHGTTLGTPVGPFTTSRGSVDGPASAAPLWTDRPERVAHQVKHPDLSRSEPPAALVLERQPRLGHALCRGATQNVRPMVGAARRVHRPDIRR